ncbi:MAG: 50S ribosomal protein L25 [Patescibacteria group bacterium]
MTKEIKLKAQTKKKGEEKPEKLRKENFIPVILYGPDSENQELKIKKIDFEKIFELAGESSLVDLSIDDKDSVKILIKEVQKNPIKDDILHADFYKVDMKKEITTEIPLHFVGESPAVKELGAILVKDIDGVEVECLPGDLVNHIDVDLSVLKNLHDSIKMEDLKIPTGMKLVNETNDVVAIVIEPRVEVEEPAPVEGEAAAEGTQATPEGKEGDASNSEQSKK